MKYRLLGNSGLRVSELALGAMTFGEDWGWGAGKEEAKKVYDAYREGGGNFIDTANVYTNGSSESFWANSCKVTGKASRWQRNIRTRCRVRTRMPPGTTART